MALPHHRLAESVRSANSGNGHNEKRRTPKKRQNFNSERPLFILKLPPRHSRIPNLVPTGCSPLSVRLPAPYRIPTTARCLAYGGSLSSPTPAALGSTNSYARLVGQRSQARIPATRTFLMRISERELAWAGALRVPHKRIFILNLISRDPRSAVPSNGAKRRPTSLSLNVSLFTAFII